MKKFIILFVALTMMSCISHKDIAQAQTEMFEQTLLYHKRQKVEIYVQTQVNRWFLRAYQEHGQPYVELLDVEIITAENGEGVTVYSCGAVMITETEPYVVTHMTISVLDNFEGIGQFTFEINPWDPTGEL